LIRIEQRMRRARSAASSQQNYDNAPQEKFDCDMRAHPFDATRERRPRLAQRAAKRRRKANGSAGARASFVPRRSSQTRGKHGGSEDRGAVAQSSVADHASACAPETRTRSPFARIVRDCLAEPQPRAIIR